MFWKGSRASFAGSSTRAVTGAGASGVAAGALASDCQPSGYQAHSSTPSAVAPEPRPPATARASTRVSTASAGSPARARETEKTCPGRCPAPMSSSHSCSLVSVAVWPPKKTKRLRSLS